MATGMHQRCSDPDLGLIFITNKCILYYLRLYNDESEGIQYNHLSSLARSKEELGMRQRGEGGEGEGCDAT